MTRQVGSPPADLAGGPASTGRSRAPEPPIRVVLAVPSIVVLVGAAGSGKSTLAARLFEPVEIVSSDDLREAISGDASDQRVTRLAFSILHRDVRSRIASGRLVVVDATNLGVGARRGLLRIAAAAAVPATAIVLRTPADVVHAQNGARSGRVVPMEIVDRHLAALDQLGLSAAEITAVLISEGFSVAHVLPDPAGVIAIDRVELGAEVAPAAAAAAPAG